MLYLPRKGFTLVEIITVVFIVALLSTALYIGSQPYMKRSRDTKRISDIASYMNIIEAYNANLETFPSNYGSGSTLVRGYCLSEMATRANYVGFQDMQFQSQLGSSSSTPPRDPTSSLDPIAPCTMTGSYFYSRIDYGTNKQIAIIATRLEIRESANYGTWADLVLSGSINSIVASKTASPPSSTPDALHVNFRMR
jgi:prepilin-type N-terminal cleavage/methylation domain-containing protein